jgi:hypothetical protein
VALNTVESGRIRPENTRNSVMRPTYGSEIVLKTNVVNGPAGSPLRSCSSPSFVITLTGGRSAGDGKASTMNSATRSTPIPCDADPHNTGANLAWTRPALTPRTISSAESSPSSRYFSSRVSSASATASVSFSR